MGSRLAGTSQRRTKLRRGAALLGAIWIGASAQPGAAQEGLASQEPYEYQVIEMGLADVLRDFGANLGFAVNVSPNVSGRVVGPAPEGTPREFLDALGREFNFSYYFDGQVLHVTSAAESETRLLTLGEVAFQELAQSLTELDLLDPRFVLRPAAEEGIVLVSGPPRYVALVETTLDALARSGRAPGEATEAVAEAAGRPTRPAPIAGPPLIVFRGDAIAVYPSGRPE